MKRWIRYIAVAVGTYLVFVFAWYGYVVHQFDTKVAPHAAEVGKAWNHPNAQAVLAVLGDSTAYGAGASDVQNTMAYRAYIELAYHGRHRGGVLGETLEDINNRAVIGARLADVVDQQLPELAGQSYGYLMICVGANDATHLTSLSDYRRDLVRLFEQLKSRPDNTVFIATAPDMGVVGGVPPSLRWIVQARAKAENAILKDTAPPGVIVVDLYEQGKLDYMQHPNYYAADMFHPSDDGYAVWSNLFSRAIEQAVPREEDDDSNDLLR